MPSTNTGRPSTIRCLLQQRLIPVEVGDGYSPDDIAVARDSRWRREEGTSRPSPRRRMGAAMSLRSMVLRYTSHRTVTTAAWLAGVISHDHRAYEGLPSSLREV